MPISLLDLIVLGVVVISALLAAVRGLTREVLAIASWVIAAIAALMFHPQLVPIVQQHISNPNVALAISIAAIFLVTLVVISFITVRLSDLVLDSRIGAIDRTLGFLFGAARGLLVCIIAFIFFTWLVPEKMQPDWAKSARMKPFLQSSGDKLMAMLPEDPEGLISKYRNRQKQNEGGEPPAEGDTTKPPAVTPAPAPATPGRT
jgi:membrane protein required for colicin V production